MVVDPWCHGSSLERDPLSGRWIFGHMGSGQSKRQCRVCADGVTKGSDPSAPCPRESTVPESAAAHALVSGSDSPENWTAAPGLINKPNCLPHFMSNGTLFYACPWMRHADDAACNNQNAGMTLSRAETLEDALKGHYTYRFRAPTMLLGGTNASFPWLGISSGGVGG